MSPEREAIRDAQRQLRAQLREEMRGRQGTPQQIRAVRRLFIGTVLFALIFVIVEFGQYLPFYPKSAYIRQVCTVVSVEPRSVSGSLDSVSIWQAADGTQYRVPESRQDYVGRTEMLYTFRGDAIRMQYEIPRAYLLRCLTVLVIAAMLASELWCYIKYKQNRSRKSGAAKGENHDLLSRR